MSPELTELAERLNKLESQNRKLKRVKHVVAVASLAVGLISPVYGQQMSAFKANDIVKFCKVAVETDGKRLQSVEDGGMSISCLYYLRGFVDGFVSASLLHNGFKQVTAMCIPEDATAVQLAKVFLKYMDEHPEQLHLPASIPVFVSLAKTFPCKQ